MPIYKKYITQNILAPLLVLAFVMTSFAWIAQTLRMLYLVERGVRVKHFLQIIPLFIPSLLFTLLPIITVIAAIYSYEKLQNNKELIILRASGVSNMSLLKPALLVSFFVTIFAIFLAAYLMPMSHHMLKNRLDELKNNYVSKAVEPRTFQQISKSLTIYVDKKHQDHSFEGVVLFYNHPEEEKTIVFAENGAFVSYGNNVSLDLSNGAKQSYDQNGNLTKLYFDNLTVQMQSFTPESEDERDLKNSELYLHNLLWPSSILPINVQQRLIADGQQRLMWALYNYVFTFLALSILLRSSYNRQSKITAMLFAFVPVFILAYIHFSLQKLAYKNSSFALLGYFNIALSLTFSLWHSKRRTL